MASRSASLLGCGLKGALCGRFRASGFGRGWTGAAAGSVGYWHRDWQGEEVYEIGWMVLPEFQGRGIAAAATGKAIAHARADGGRRRIHAFPGVENVPSNAICRKIGFELAGEIDFEYPPGSTMRCNDWRLDL